MMELNNFRLSHETAILFVFSYEYDIPFAKMLDLYKVSEKIFWAYQDTFANMSKMGVRKASQLAKMANRIYKDVHGIKDRKKRKVEVICTDEEGYAIRLEDGSQKVAKHVITEYEPVVLDTTEKKIRDILSYYITKGYSNGDKFYTDEEVMDMHIGVHNYRDTVDIEGEPYVRTSKIEFLFEKYFPEVSTADYRKLSTRKMGELIDKALLLAEENIPEVA